MTKRVLSEAERVRRSERMRQMNKDAGVRAKINAKRREGGWENPIIARRLRDCWKDPAYRAKMTAALKNPETVEKAKAARKAARKAAVEARRAAGLPARSKGSFPREMVIERANKRYDVAVAVPAWVPNGLIDDYCYEASLYGEEHAASVVRAMKRAELAGEGDHA